ncbi:hypothetical protein B0H16DRAFT_1748084 [Mycena metata]|uniref:Uncharacterized protein n=1 Tax=Mycena metata TaxID=1033252 RepID=A0AAD7E1D9_9AGAR|nr:hypothetical protein B0H16DRAFT_1748084 [Mycena metata]
MAAQRIANSYAEDDYPDEQGGTGEELESWGGSQFDADDAAHPKNAPDLADLIAFSEDKGGARVAAMRLQYFSMRIARSAPENARWDHPMALITERSDLFSSSARVDMERLHQHRKRLGEPPFTKEEEANRLRELVLAPEYPFGNETTFTEIVHAFQVRQGDNPWSRATTQEWDAILLLDEAEHVQDASTRNWVSRRGNTPFVSSVLLAQNRSTLVSEADHFISVISINTRVCSQAITLANESHDALTVLARCAAPLRPQVTPVLDHDINRSIVEEMEALAASIDLDTPRQNALLTVIEDELHRRGSVNAASDDYNGDPPMEDLNPDADEDSDAEDPPGNTDTDRGKSDPPSPDAPSGDEEGASEYPPPGFSPPLQYSSDPEDAHQERDSPLPLMNVGTATDEPGPSWLTIVDFSFNGIGFLLHDDAGQPYTSHSNPPEFEERGSSPAGPDSDDELWRQMPTPSESLMELPQAQNLQDGPSISLNAQRLVWPDEPFADPGLSAQQERVERLLDEHPEDKVAWILGVGCDDGDRFLSALDTYGTDDGLLGPEHSPAANLDSDKEIVLVDTCHQEAEPRPEVECLLRSLVMFTSDTAEVYSTFVDHAGRLYFTSAPLPANHPFCPENRIAHSVAMDLAVRERAADLNANVFIIREQFSWRHSGQEPTRTRFEYTNEEPRLFPGRAIHERVAAHSLDSDDEDALPGSRVRTMAQRVEHMASVNRQDAPRVGLTEQPSRLPKDIMCLTAEVEIGGSKSYMLFNTGSNMDSLTPEYARATNCRMFKLEEQVTLQLGCVGSQSRINYGAHAPINFGGIKGHTYFDLVNLDRYNAMIGMPFMIKHSLVLNFGKREVRFPNGRVLATLTLGNETRLLTNREQERAPCSNKATASSTPPL